MCGPGFGRAAAQPADQGRGERVVQQRTLARAAHAGHADQRRKRETGGDALEIVRRRAFDGDRAGHRHAAAAGGHGNPLRAGQVAAGERGRIGRDLRRRAFGHDPPAVPPRAGAEIDEPIGAAHDRLVVLDDEHRVAAVSQAFQGLDQPFVVAGMQADRRLVEHVAHAHQSRSPARWPAARAATRRR